MPAENFGESDGNDEVEGSVGWGNTSGGEERKEADLKSVGGNGDGPGDPVLRTAKGAEVIKPTSEGHS